MLRSVDALINYRLMGKDDAVGEVHDLYFDDAQWKVRYLAVDTGVFLPGRKVLIAASGLGEPDWANETLMADVTRENVKSAPEIDWARPVSRQEEEALHMHFAWAPYWTPYGLAGSGHPMAVPVEGVPVEEREPAEPAEEEQRDETLRSFREVKGYDIHAQDGHIGHLEDLIVDDIDWVLPMFVVDTRNWIPGKQVLLATEWIGRIDWANTEVYVDLKRDTIKEGPEFDPAEPVNKEVEVRLYDYYGRPTRHVSR